MNKKTITAKILKMFAQDLPFARGFIVGFLSFIKTDKSFLLSDLLINDRIVEFSKIVQILERCEKDLADIHTFLREENNECE